MFSFDLIENELDLEEKYLCLEFANTIGWRNSERREEWLNSYADLVNWARDTGLMTETETAALMVEAGRRPAEAEAALQRAVTLRDGIYQIFSSVIHASALPEGALERLNEALSEAGAHAELVEREGHFEWQWKAHPGDLTPFLWPVARSAGDLLTSEDLHRVGECASDQGCGWLFYDNTKNHSRRWCSMDSCGNRAKANRHYKKKSLSTD